MISPSISLWVNKEVPSEAYYLDIRDFLLPITFRDKKLVFSSFFKRRNFAFLERISFVSHI